MIDPAKLLAKARVTLRCEPEETPIRGNASAVDDEHDAETERWILDQLASGNQWAWCTAIVRVEYLGEHEDTYLGCCSYESEDAFCEPGGYFDDMKLEAATDLARRLDKLLEGSERDGLTS